MQSKRVLLVDDDPRLTIILAAGLEKLNSEYIVETAENGSEALSKLQQNHYALVITDYSMPDMNGLKLAESIRQISPQTQIILMTGHGTDRVRQAADSLVLAGYIDKPFTLEELRVIVDRAVGQTQQLGLGEDPYRSGAQVVNANIIEVLQTLQANTAARCVLLLSAGGYPVQIAGQTNSLDIISISALVAANFMAAAELARLLGTGSIFKSSYHEGNDYNIYAYKITEELLLAVIFGREGKPGMVWFYTKQTATRLLPLLPEIAPPRPFMEDISAALSDELDQLLPSDDMTGSRVISFEEAAATGLIPKELLQRELNGRSDKKSY